MMHLQMRGGVGISLTCGPLSWYHARGAGLNGQPRVEGNAVGILAGVVIGFLAWLVVRCILAGFYTVDQNERAVKTVFGRAQRLGRRRRWTIRSPSRSATTNASDTPIRRSG